MSKYRFLFTALTLTLLSCFSSCESIDLDQTEDPSGVNPKFLDPITAFNFVQLEFEAYINSNNGFTQEVTRQLAMTSGNNYSNAYTPANFNLNWDEAYGILNAVKFMEPKSIEKKEFYALGAAKVIESYVLMTLADTYGDVPYSEALLGIKKLDPKFDKSADIYIKALSNLDVAIGYLTNTNSSTKNVFDLFYTSKNKWVTLANTMKLRMYNNARNAGSEIGIADIKTAMNSIIAANDIIDNPDEDFSFKYGAKRANPNTRHPLYNRQYELGGGDYIANYMFWTMAQEKIITPGTSPTVQTDPRTSFYFLRRDGNPSDDSEFVLPRKNRPEHYNETRYASFYDQAVRTPFLVSNWLGIGSLPSGGFWGRDHGNADGIPQDNEKRTVCGLYPIGGKYESNNLTTSFSPSGTEGALGAGILPIMMSSFVHFIKAEAILTIGVNGVAKDEFLLGVNASIDRVATPINNYPILSTSAIATINTQQTNYVSYLSTRYDALTDAKKLEMIVKEYFIAAWGNGIEPYNNYRRTGYPSNFQPTLEPISGQFYATALYPQVSVGSNLNAPANVQTKKVFWDKLNIELK